MLKNHQRIYLLIFLFGFFVSACAQLGLQSKKEPQEPSSIPACKKNYTKEGNFITGRVYKSWVKYGNLDYKRGFETTVSVLKSPGHRVIYADRDSGTINGEMTFGSKEPKMYPVEITLLKEKTSLTIYLSTKSAVGSSAQETFCRFYEAFEKGIKRTSSSPQPKQMTAPPKKSQETEKESVSTATALPPSTPKPAPPPSPAAPLAPPPSSMTPLDQAEVTWSYVNLREGPGTKYKIIRKLKRGTPLDIFDEERGWLQVQLDDGTEGWLSKSATSMKPKTPPPPPAPSPQPSAPPPPPPASEPPKPESPM